MLCVLFGLVYTEKKGGRDKALPSSPNPSPFFPALDRRAESLPPRTKRRTDFFLVWEKACGVRCAQSLKSPSLSPPFFFWQAELCCTDRSKEWDEINFRSSFLLFPPLSSSSSSFSSPLSSTCPSIWWRRQGGRGKVGDISLFLPSFTLEKK